MSVNHRDNMVIHRALDKFVDMVDIPPHSAFVMDDFIVFLCDVLKQNLSRFEDCSSICLSFCEAINRPYRRIVMDIALPQIHMILRDGKLPQSTIQKVLKFVLELEKLPMHFLTRFSNSLINEIRVEKDSLLTAEQKAIRQRCSFSLKKQLEVMKEDVVHQTPSSNPTATATGIMEIGTGSKTLHSSLELNPSFSSTFTSTSVAITEKLHALFTVDVGIGIIINCTIVIFIICSVNEYIYFTNRTGKHLLTDSGFPMLPLLCSIFFPLIEIILSKRFFLHSVG